MPSLEVADDVLPIAECGYSQSEHAVNGGQLAERGINSTLSWRVPGWDVVHRCLVGFAQGSGRSENKRTRESAGPAAQRQPFGGLRSSN